MAIMKEAKTLTFGDDQYIIVDAEAREKIAELEHNLKSDQFLNQRGTGILNITTSPSSYTTVTPDGGTPKYRILLSTVLAQASADKVLVGDILMYSTYLYPVYYVDDSYVYTRSRTSIRGEDGTDGQRGTGILRITTKPGYQWNVEDGEEYLDSIQIALSVVKSQAKVDEVLVGDLLLYDSTLYRVEHVDTRIVYLDTNYEVSLKGETPQKSVDYFTETDKQEIAEQAAQLVEVPEGGGGLTNAQISALDGMFKIAAYTENAEAAYTAFKIAFGITDEPVEPEEPDEPDEPEIVTYSIIVELVHATSNNRATSVTEGARYTATLTANDGYTLEGATVTVLMGGVNITSTAYADGVISIPAVTGNVEIVVSAVEIKSEEPSAVLVTDGLLGYWDMRNPAEVVVQNWHWAYPSNEGDGGLYASVKGGSMDNKELPTFNEYGTQTDFRIMRGSNTYPAWVDYGTEFTFVLLTHGYTPGEYNAVNGIAHSNVPPMWEFQAAYYKTDGSTAKTDKAGSGNGDITTDYNFAMKRVNGAEMKVIMDTSEHVFLGTDYDNFDYWNQQVFPSTAYNGGTVIAFALYNRALTDVEIEEMRAFMKTLEVA